MSLSRSEASATVRRAIDRLARAGKSKQALLRRRRGWGRPGCERDSRVTQSGRLDRSALHPSTPFRALEARADGLLNVGIVSSNSVPFRRVGALSLVCPVVLSQRLIREPLRFGAGTSTVQREFRRSLGRFAPVLFGRHASTGSRTVRAGRLSRSAQRASREFREQILGGMCLPSSATRSSRRSKNGTDRVLSRSAGPVTAVVVRSVARWHRDTRR